MIRSNPLLHRLRRHKTMATLYRSIDTDVVVGDGPIAYPSPFQPGKPIIMASLVRDRDAYAVEPLPAEAAIRPAAPRPTRSDVAPPAIQRRPATPATPKSSQPSSPAEKLAAQKPIPADEPSIAESESADFDWIDENEWTSLKSFMEGHQKKLAEEKGEAASEPVQRVPEDSGRDEVQEQTRAELARRQELARRGQLPRAQVEYISGDERPRPGASPAPSSEPAEPVQTSPEEPGLSSADQDTKSEIEQTETPADDAAQIPSPPIPAVQRTEVGPSSPVPESRSIPDATVQDTPGTQKPVFVDKTPVQDEPETSDSVPEVVPEPHSADFEESPDLQRTPEVAVKGSETSDRSTPEMVQDRPTSAEGEQSGGLRNRILAAARSLFRGNDDPEESTSSVPVVESDVSMEEEAPSTPGQDLIHRTPVEGETLGEEAHIVPGMDHDTLTESIVNVESPKTPTDSLEEASSPPGVVDVQEDRSLGKHEARPADPESVPGQAMPASAVPTVAKSHEETPGFPGDSPVVELPETGPATGTRPDVSRKPNEVTGDVPEAGLPAAERKESVDSAGGEAMVDLAGADETNISDLARSIPSGDEADTLIQVANQATPEYFPPSIERKEVAESPPGPEAAGSTGTEEAIRDEPDSPRPTADSDDSDGQKTEGAIESQIDEGAGQESPQMPSELELSEPPTQTLPLEAVWPVEKTEPPTIIPTPVKKVDISSPGPAVQRKPAGDDAVTGKLHSALKDVEPGKPTDSSIELVPPRRPRPIPPERPQPPAADVQTKPAQTKPPAPGELPPSAEQTKPKRKESPYLVPTEVGEIPSDFWEYLGEKPPPPSSEKSFSQDVARTPSPPDLRRSAESSESLVTQEFPQVDVQRVASPVRGQGDRSGGAEESGESEDTGSSEMELNISELARQVFPEIKRRLTVDWERGRGRF